MHLQGSPEVSWHGGVWGVVCPHPVRRALFLRHSDPLCLWPIACEVGWQHTPPLMCLGVFPRRA